MKLLTIFCASVSEYYTGSKTFTLKENDLVRTNNHLFIYF